MSWRTIVGSIARRLEDDARQVAVIDLGSNSWRLVVYTFVPRGWWKRTDELYEMVRIGAGLATSGRISPEALERGMETLSIFRRFCAAHAISGRSIHAVATSAIREADNREEFLAMARERTSVEVEVLSARDEARMGYLAAINTTTLAHGLVLELGGGSIQLISVRGRRAVEMASFPLGAVSLTEELLPGAGPAKKKELERVRARVREALSELPWVSEAGRRLVGLGGAVRNLAVAVQRRSDGAADVGVQGFRISRETLAELVRALAAMSVQERGFVPGVKPGRGDIILAAALTIEAVMEIGSFEAIEVTEAGLREGVFFERELFAGADPVFGDVRSAAVRNLAVQYESDLPHVEHVARLCMEMFDSLVAAGALEAKDGERELLWAAAMLHDVGMAIDYGDHHKHSQYLIASGHLPGFDPRERALIAQISRYHRKGAPKLGEITALAEQGDEELLERCAVILRLAEHLERGRDQSVREASLSGNGELRLRVVGDLTLPRWTIDRYGDGAAFERAFGRKLVVG